MRLRLVTLALLTFCLVGCASTVVLHPINKTDIFRITKGTQVGADKAELDGYFLSDAYLAEVVKVRVK